jgi:N-acetylneuraminic acid mutarotase
MTILVTAPGEFIGGELQVGEHYNVEPASEGSSQQNRYFHKLLMLYFNSGAYSDPAKTVGELKNYVKSRLGAGAESYVFIDTNGKKQRSKTMPENVWEHNGERYIWKKLLSWADYSKKQRKETIHNLVQEMITVGVNSREFESILADMENNQFTRQM